MSKIRHVNTAVLEHFFGIAMGIAVPLFLSMKLADYLEEEEEVLHVILQHCWVHTVAVGYSTAILFMDRFYHRVAHFCHDLL